MSTSSTTRYELFYFPSPGRGEVIRFLLQYGKVNWTERHPTNWADEKPTTPFGCLPVLTEFLEDGTEFQLGESHAIERYLARKFGLVGANEREAALIDSYAEGWATLINYLVQIRFAKTEEAKEAATQSYKTTATEIINYHGSQLSKNGNGFYVGDKLSLVDILAYVIIKLVKQHDSDAFDNVSAFDKLQETIENHQVIGSYARERSAVKAH
ncbi:hypothetical protein K493DRAFT_411977 [Basidiobolus meristosporus CBS 931.73]|uniref:Glutathione S-transferase n=1 Tax=Basidiobolus meristosporus CBS 931.73 TaxID=1314790 RepID=A0A1Y1X7R0_9FUNG|nr:hypothetical protein K493DRAFT_411977 [Basidiobolus meristosporus CBS 931.73]|eukprot:ORX81416.1 hypothetical protein K493DRAFT_411977 [Basidiobolus meristosporus CBS 931.73]